MATILGVKTINGVDILNVQSDPNGGGGTAANVGSIAVCANGNGTFVKTTSSNTGWTQFVINGGSDEIIDTGSGNFFFDARLAKQGYANLFAGTNYIYISNIKPGDVYIFELIAGSILDEVYIVDDAFFYPTMVPAANTTGGGSYIMTPAIGAVDRVIVTFDGATIYVSPIGQNFTA